MRQTAAQKLAEAKNRGGKNKKAGTQKGQKPSKKNVAAQVIVVGLGGEILNI